MISHINLVNHCVTHLSKNQQSGMLDKQETKAIFMLDLV